jgi:hypothetical protein
MAFPKLQVQVTADTKQAEDGLKKVSGDIGQVEKASTRAVSAVKAFAVGLASIATVSAVFSRAVAESQKFETTMFRIGAVIKATGGVAGRTADDLRSFARELAMNTLESTEGVLEAQQRLLTFRKVTGDVFDRTIRVAADLSAVLGQNMSSSAIQLGRALEDPVTGLSALARSGTVFTDQQKEMVKKLVESGQLLKAQSFILDELEAQYGGAAVAAAQGYAGALDTLGQRLQEFFLSIDENLGLTKALSAIYLTAAEALRVLTENMGRLVTYIGTAMAASVAYAAFMARGWVAAFVAARVATFSLAGAMAFLRTALIRTGIGALVVALGEGVYQFSRISKAAGGFGEAVALIGEVFTATWNGVLKSVPELGPAFRGVTRLVMGLWGDMIAWMSQKIGVFLGQFGRRIANIPGLGDASSALNQMAADFGQSQLGLSAEADAMRQSGQNILGGVASNVADNFKPVTESVQKIRDLLASIKDERITLPDLLGVGTDEGDGGGGKGKKGKSLDEKLTEQEKRIKEHFDRVKALAKGGLSDKLGAWGDYFSNLIQLTGSNNKKLLAAQKTFVAAQALIDAFGAYNKVLNDPTPQPWYVRLAAAGQVFAAAMGAVNAIRSASTSGGASSASVPSASAGASSTAPAMATQTVAINLQGDTFSRASVEGLLEQIQSQLDRGGRLVFQ